MWWNKYIGTPFEERGRGPDGYDCWGLARLIMKQEKNIDLPCLSEIYEKTTDHILISDAVLREQKIGWKEITRPAAFDFIVMRQMGVPMHIGVVTKPGYMIHCERGIDAVHVKYNSLRWEKRIEGFFRYERD